GAAPVKVWDALTSSGFTERYFFGRRVESEWAVGSAWRLLRPDGAIDVEGVVRESVPPRKLVLTWRAVGMIQMKEPPESVVTYEIEAVGDEAVRLTMTEAHPTPIPAFLLEGGRRGWPMILSGLKTLLETGRPLELQTPEPPRKE
ncbi:MAG: SRPBCC family protein, partial [Planctomycetia bacterium]